MFRLPEPHENPHGKIHYIFGYGTVGCIPDTLEVFMSQEDAIEFFATLFDDLPENTLRRYVRELSEFWRVDMPVINVAEISECDCGEPWIHSEDVDQYQIQEWLDWLDEE